MVAIERYHLRKVRHEDLALILAWRNAARIRVNMHTNHIISNREHLAWYERTVQDPMVECLLLEYAGRPAGVVNLSGIDRINCRCTWGFYLGKRDLPKGSGTAMGLLSVDYAFDEIGMHKVSGEVLEFNTASCRLFSRLGFTCEGRFRQHVRREGVWVSVRLYSLIIDEWRGGARERIVQVLKSGRARGASAVD